jgi:cytochrome c5
MIKAMLTCALLAALGTAALAAAKPAPPKGTASVALPGDAGTAFKDGPGVANAQRYCLTCHSSAYVSMQPPFTNAQWTAEVTKMRAAYGAQIPDDAVKPIADYLTAVYGKP